MRILVDNYVSEKTTEPVYLDRCFKIAGANSHLWDRRKASLYDMFDQFSPEVFVTDYKRITPELAKYLSGSRKRIYIVLNVTGAANQQLEAILSFLQNCGSKSPFCFTNVPSAVGYDAQGKLKVESIMHGADIFLPSHSHLDYQIDTAVLAVGGLDPANPDYAVRGSYHIINCGATEDYKFDAKIPIHQGPSIYRNYNKLVVFGTPDKVFCQTFFDAALHANDFSVWAKDKADADMCHKVMEDLRMNNVDSRVSILRSHTALHRAKRFLSKLKCKELCTNLDKAIGELA